MEEKILKKRETGKKEQVKDRKIELGKRQLKKDREERTKGDGIWSRKNQ
jgi:hypothetical protein